MKHMKYIITTIGLLLSGGLIANAAWTSSQSAHIWEKDTDAIAYDYQIESTTNLVPGSLGYTVIPASGVATEKQVHCDGLVVDFRENARYEISFEVTHYNTAGKRPATAMLSMVNSGNDVSLLFGNSTEKMGVVGVILGSDINATPYYESISAGSCGSRIWTPWLGSGNPNYGDGDFQYKIIFETFADENIADKIYFGVTNENSKQSTYFLILTCDHLGCGGARNQVFDDIGFNLIGDIPGNTPNSTVNGQAGVELVGNIQSQPQSTFTKWTRKATPINQPSIPEPSSFGLLASAGVLAFAVSRRRRSRS